MDQFIIFSIWLLVLAAVIFITFLLAQAYNPPKAPSDMTLEKFFPHERSFEAALLQAKAAVDDEEDLEFLSTLSHLYRQHGLKAPMTQEAYDKLISIR